MNGDQHGPSFSAVGRSESFAGITRMIVVALPLIAGVAGWVYARDYNATQTAIAKVAHDESDRNKQIWTQIADLNRDRQARFESENGRLDGMSISITTLTANQNSMATQMGSLVNTESSLAKDTDDRIGRINERADARDAANKEALNNIKIQLGHIDDQLCNLRHGTSC